LRKQVAGDSAAGYCFFLFDKQIISL